MNAVAASLAICAVALLLEAGLGYPDWLFRRIGHPVSWIGALIATLDTRLNREADTAATRRAWGFAAIVGLVLVVAGGAAATQVALFALPHVAAILFASLLASTCLAQRSLDAHVRAVAEALERISQNNRHFGAAKPNPEPVRVSDRVEHPGSGFSLREPRNDEPLDAARAAVGRIVGRDTASLDEAGIARAAIESLAENFSDGIVAPALWLALAGLPGGFAYKAVNTADSMIGHRTPRHEAFGFAAAKLDDLVNWPAARLAALWLMLAAALTPGASAGEAWRIVRRDARGHASPNAGWPEAAMAGALSLTLGGPRVYAGRRVEDATMGDGTALVDAATIRRALRLYRVACGLQIAAVTVLAHLLSK